jgi:hypothetical protein
MVPVLTSGKLVSGIGFAITAFLAAEFYQMLVPDLYTGQWISVWAAALGFIVGWRILGNQLSCDLRTAARRGALTSIWLFIWAMVLFSSAEMIRRSMQHRAPDPGEAIGKVFEIIIDFSVIAWDVKVIAALIFGGLISGIVAELSNRRWH